MRFRHDIGHNLSKSLIFSRFRQDIEKLWYNEWRADECEVHVKSSRSLTDKTSAS